MAGSRYVVLGLAHVRSPWSTEVARWATAGSVPVEFVKCVSVEELRARLLSGRPHSAALLDGRLSGVDRDLLDLAAGQGCPTLVVAGDVERDWSALGRHRGARPVVDPLRPARGVVRARVADQPGRAGDAARRRGTGHRRLPRAADRRHRARRHGAVDAGHRARAGPRRRPALLGHRLPRRHPLSHARGLAAAEALDLYVDAAGRLNVTAFNKPQADHVLRYGVDLLDLRVRVGAPSAGTVNSFGEGAASRHGSDRWHWISKNGDGCSAQSGNQSPTIRVAHGSLLTQELAESRAKAALGFASSACIFGRARILGRPDLHPRDAVEIQDAPEANQNKTFKITAVHHRFSKRNGFTTSAALQGTASDDSLGGAAAGGLAGGGFSI